MIFARKIAQCEPSRIIPSVQGNDRYMATGDLLVVQRNCVGTGQTDFSIDFGDCTLCHAVSTTLYLSPISIHQLQWKSSLKMHLNCANKRPKNGLV